MKADIVEVIGRVVNLRPRRNGFKGLCPFHKERHASFVVRTDRQTYRCYACGAKGKLEDFIWNYKNEV